MGTKTMALFANVSIELSKLREVFKDNPHHSAFTVHQNGKTYVNLTIWHNDEFDQYGNNVSIQLNSKQDQRASEGKIYIGNGKRAGTQPAAQAPAQAPIATSTELPF
jgi:hypothetical protein